jgi:hypothetical protein
MTVRSCSALRRSSPRRSEDQFAFVEVVSSTAQRDVVDGAWAAYGVGLPMMELESGLRGAPFPARRHVGASGPITKPDRAAHRRGHMARTRSDTALPLRGPVTASLPLQQRVDQLGQCPIEDLSGVAIGDRVAQQVLGRPELLAGCSADSEPDLVAARGRTTTGCWLRSVTSVTGGGGAVWLPVLSPAGPACTAWEGVPRDDDSLATGRAGSFLMMVATSGRGWRRATSSSTSRLLRRLASPISLR